MKTSRSLRLFASVRILVGTFIKNRRSSLWFLVLMLAWVASPAAQAADPIVVNQDIPIVATVSVPPLDGGSDQVDLSGVVHTLTWIMQDAQSGNCRVRFHANADGVQGVGRTTGLKYLLTGASAVAVPPNPCSSLPSPNFIFTLNAAAANPETPPNPCDITFSLKLVSNDFGVTVEVGISSVSVPVD
jgi:hypothetical protein